MKILIVGRTASGKDTLREMLEQRGVSFVQSYTDRPRRENENDDTHIFVSPDEMDNLFSEAVATTTIGAYRYCALAEDIAGHDAYIVDPNGVADVAEQFPDECLFIVYIDPINKDSQKMVALNRDHDEVALQKRMDAEDESFTAFEKTLTTATTYPAIKMRFTNDYSLDCLTNVAERITAEMRMFDRMRYILRYFIKLGVLVSPKPDFIHVVTNDEKAYDLSLDLFTLMLLSEPKNHEMLVDLLLDALRSDEFDFTQFSVESFEVIHGPHTDDADNLRSIASFLHENEQFGDDWSCEIASLDTAIDILDNMSSDTSE